MSLNKKELQEVRELQLKAAETRRDFINLTYVSGYSHLGGPLSACDFATALYYRFINWNKDMLNNPERDRFILSKGHNGDLLYCIFAKLGLYTMDELLKEYKAYLGRWGEHPNRFHNPGFEICSGSLGHGLPMALGMAVGGRRDKSKRRVYVMVGDGELQEGSNWEAIMCGGHQKFNNLVLVVDKNKVQSCRMISETINDDNLAERIASFGFDVKNLKDGNDMKEIYECLRDLPEVDWSKEQKPICIILNTVKGKGVKYMEDGKAKWHAGGIGDDKIDETYKSIEDELNADLAITDKLIAEAE